MNTHGAVLLEPPWWEGKSYDEVQREYTVRTLCEIWEATGEAFDPIVLGVPHVPADPTQLRLMMELLTDGASEDVVAAAMP